mmetsp:Transcript_63308/g.141027  ORF Transcript_63308/g.141027 Transcript_63308/m.141027 type:complete len:204 (+) Transcript_63308:268-879(+)
MHHLHGVQVVHTTEDLLHDNRRLILREVARIQEAVEEFASAAKLHDNVHVPSILEVLVESDDMRVVEHFQRAELILKHDQLGFPPNLLEHLHRPFSSSGLVGALHHPSEGALPNLLVLHIVEVVDVPAVVNDVESKAGLFLRLIIKQAEVVLLAALLALALQLLPPKPIAQSGNAVAHVVSASGCLRLPSAARFVGSHGRHLR